jgi:hypothetical protein
MEATGACWKPFSYLLEDGPLELMLVNPVHARNLPGRETDVSDAQRLAELGAHVLVSKMSDGDTLATTNAASGDRSGARGDGHGHRSRALFAGRSTYQGVSDRS